VSILRSVSFKEGVARALVWLDVIKPNINTKIERRNDQKIVNLLDPR
jgi:hypothetical protein